MSGWSVAVSGNCEYREMESAFLGIGARPIGISLDTGEELPEQKLLSETQKLSRGVDG
jgi:hypothetical protein